MEYLGPILNILIPIAIGIALRQFRVFGEDDSRSLRRFCIQFTVPLLVFVSMYTAETGVFGQLFPMVAAVIVMTACFYLVGFAASRVAKEKPDRAAIHASISFGNYGWIGWAVANVVLGIDGFQRAVFFTALWWPTFYSFGLLVGVAHHEPEEKRGVLRMMVSRLAPVAVALVVGITGNLADVELPTIIFSTAKTFGDMTVHLILLSVGLDLDFSSLSASFTKALLVSIVRLTIGPCIGLFVAFVIRLVFRIDDTSYLVILLLGAVPVATTTPVLADHFPMNNGITGASIVLSTILSLVVLPIWISIVAAVPS